VVPNAGMKKGTLNIHVESISLSMYVFKINIGTVKYNRKVNISYLNNILKSLIF